MRSLWAFTVRLAAEADVPALETLIAQSVRTLQAADYSPEQIEGALGTVFGVDSQLIADRTYFVVESDGILAGCGGWSKRRTLFGSDQHAGREADLLDPAKDVAKIRAFFVHPDWARQGVASNLLEACEVAAQEAGFSRLELGATLTGVAFYSSRGYVANEPMEVALRNGATLPILKMVKTCYAKTR